MRYLATFLVCAVCCLAADDAMTLLTEAANKTNKEGGWEGEATVVEGPQNMKTRLRFLSEPDSNGTRTRIEVLEGEEQLVRVCMKEAESTYRVASKQFTKTEGPSKAGCGFPILEVQARAAEVRDARIVGREVIQRAKSQLKCTKVQGRLDDAVVTLWIADFTKFIERYQRESPDGKNQTIDIDWVVVGGALLRKPWFALTAAPDAHAFLIPGKPVMPVLIYKVEPDYTRMAKMNRIEGTVVLRGVVDPNGTARDLQIVRKLDSGLDKQAAIAISKWKFKPGRRDDKPVPMRVTFEINFKLR